MTKAIILAGGIGSRLWPLSREIYPKQLLRLTGKWSLLQSTMLRAKAAGITDIMVVASHAHRFYVQEQIDELALSDAIDVTLLLEPVGRNTAPAIALAALYANPHDTLWVMPADHVLEIDDLSKRLMVAQQLANSHYLVTFGVMPKHPETGYGYIQQGSGIAGVDRAYRVNRFIEKPTLSRAQEYILSADFLWNSGMYCFQAGVYLQALHQHSPHIYDACLKTHKHHYHDLGFVKYPEVDFLVCPNQSIDYAIMEQTQLAAVVPLVGQWSDIGSWNALYALESQDASSNVLLGHVVAENTTGCLVHAQSRLVATVGVTDLVIVETADALLIADRHQDQAVKQVLTRLKQDQCEERLAPSYMYRPWGHYEVLVKTAETEVRLVTIKAGSQLGAHCHEALTKCWTVISGVVDVDINGKTHQYAELSSIKIPPGGMHQAIAVGQENVVMLELMQQDLSGASQCESTSSDHPVFTSI